MNRSQNNPNPHSQNPNSVNTGTNQTGTQNTVRRNPTVSAPLTPSGQSSLNHINASARQSNTYRPQSSQTRPVNRPSGQQTGYRQPQQNYRIGLNDNYDPYPQVKHRPRRSKKKAAILLVMTVIILVMLFISVMIFAARCSEKNPILSVDTPSVTDTVSDVVTTTEEVTTEPETTVDTSRYEYLIKSESEIHKGYQILVNYQNEFMFDNIFKLQTFYGNRNRSYKISSINISLDKTAMEWCNKMMEAFEGDLDRHDILANSAYRTYEEQEEIYAYRVDQYGEEYAVMFVAVPGYSEHHTGLAVDFAVYTDDNKATTFDELTDYAAWMSENSHKFGYILRYPSDKTDITKIGYENWHYRYVGKPHAYYMYKNNLCLEEYIDTLRNYTFAGEHLMITDDEDNEWEIYFVASMGVQTSVPVPLNEPYELSGNNVDGFIVTIQK